MKSLLDQYPVTKIAHCILCRGEIRLIRVSNWRLCMTTTKYSECGCCGQFHRSDFWGDCRNDEERFNEEDIPKDATITYIGRYIEDPNDDHGCIARILQLGETCE